jgi:prepilin-type N-terminal cleavage/methylation domain-containing protein
MLQKGVTLIEVLLVMVIMSSVFVMLIGYTTQKTEQIRIDRATLQMQQILNAGMAYYVNNGNWPVPTCGTASSLSPLQTSPSNYLPSTVNNPWGGTYTINCSSTTGTFSVTANITAASASTLAVLAGRLPMGVTGTNTVTASVNIPGQNLNNARSVNFAGIFHPDACVPVPSCPSGMTVQIMVTPAQVTGNNISYLSSSTAFPLVNFSAYATGPNKATSTSGPPVCAGETSSSLSYPVQSTYCLSGMSGYSPVTINDGNQYWRVCLQVTTTQGVVAASSSAGYAWEAQQSLLVLTRCAPPSEPVGSDFNIWSGP